MFCPEDARARDAFLYGTLILELEDAHAICLDYGYRLGISDLSCQGGWICGSSETVKKRNLNKRISWWSLLRI
jgi:hypothetical protein